MKRKAILIESSDVKGQKVLPGARIDIVNWRNFLNSDLGGAWEDSEIISLNKPFSGDVEKCLKDYSDCYCFIAFSGHGCDGSVVLNDYLGNFSIGLLKPKGNQGTLIVDSCRGLAEAALVNFSNTKVALANEAGHAVALNARRGRSAVFASAAEINEHLIFNRAGIVIKSREVWEEAFKHKHNGVVEMLACSKGQSAGEDPTAGGYYTSLLLQSADLWWQSGTFTRTHTTKDAHDYAASKLPAQQTPEYKPSWLAFPFAVKI